MNWLMARILSLLSSGILKQLLRGFEISQTEATMREGIQAEIVREEIRAEIERRKAKRDVALAGMAHPAWWFGWLLFVVPTGGYYCAIIVDSLFHFSWNVAALPSPYDTWGGVIVSSLFLGQGLIGVAQIWRKR